jgi:very-short-patch-repair endonuclease
MKSTGNNFFINDFCIWIYEYNNNYWLRFSSFICGLSNGYGNSARDLKFVSKKNIYRKEPRGRNSTSYINGNGALQVLQKTIRISIGEKKRVVSELKKYNMIDDVIVFDSRKENDFYDDMSDFFKHFNIKIKRQFIIDGHLIDFLIDNLAIEYDENNHYGYNRKLEIKRGEEVIKKGYKFIRLTDNESNSSNIAIIAKELGIEKTVRSCDA